jgi:hypothetical protein
MFAQVHKTKSILLGNLLVRHFLKYKNVIFPHFLFFPNQQPSSIQLREPLLPLHGAKLMLTFKSFIASMQDPVPAAPSLRAPSAVPEDPSADIECIDLSGEDATNQDPGSEFTCRFIIGQPRTNLLVP